MFTLIFAFLLDLLIGDPVYSCHPVRLMGKFIDRAETSLRGSRLCHSRESGNPVNVKISGAILALLFPLTVFLSVSLVLFFFQRIHSALAWILNFYLIYASLSIHDLRKEGLQIYKDLRRNDLDKAREDLARIVGRDTHSLDEKNILRATIETIAESTVDGIIAPLFYAALGGAPLVLTYKAVNTLDSMIGHMNKRYRNFGFVAAKQDELWNWLPARFSYYLAALASFFVNGRTQEALFTGWQDGVSAPHGNSAIPEATFAGALGLRLGGASTYQGRLVEKPLLGFPKKDFDREDLMKSLNLMIVTSWATLVAMVLLKYGIGLI